MVVAIERRQAAASINVAVFADTNPTCTGQNTNMGPINADGSCFTFSCAVNSGDFGNPGNTDCTVMLFGDTCDQRSSSTQRIVATLFAGITDGGCVPIGNNGQAVSGFETLTGGVKSL